MDFENLQVGLKNSGEMPVTEKDTAIFVGSGSLKVLATPKMVALMEKVSAELAEKNLPEDFTSVGISLNVEHIAPTPIGMKIRVESELVEVSGRKLTFEVAAFDEAEKIGKGRHERFIVNGKKFQTKADGKFSG